MAEKIERELNEAKEQLRKAKAALDKFEEGEGKVLAELRDKLLKKKYKDEEEKKEWKEVKEELGEGKKRLEDEKARWSNQVAMLQERLTAPQPGKRKLDLDLDDENEDGDRKKVTSAQIIMKRIMELPEDPDVYSNPKNSLSLPFPFLGSNKPVERFSFNDDCFFTFMGRREFKNVLDEINKFRADSGYMEMFIYGTMGYGKSYILSAITCYLFRVKKRVVYLPDCRALSLKPVKYIKSALFLTYVNELEKINRISLCETLDIS